MLITTGGVLIRTRVAEVREMGRATQGVTLIALDGARRSAACSASPRPTTTGRAAPGARCGTPAS